MVYIFIDDCDDRTIAFAIVVAVTFFITLIVTALVTFGITILCYKRIYKQTNKAKVLKDAITFNPNVEIENNPSYDYLSAVNDASLTENNASKEILNAPTDRSAPTDHLDKRRESKNSCYVPCNDMVWRLQDVDQINADTDDTYF